MAADAVLVPEVPMSAPAFNEEDVIDLSYRRTIPVLRATGEEFEVIFVDDGSTDGTAKRVRMPLSRFAA